MKQIVTIDFDIIMGPSIDIYNDRVGLHEKDIREILQKYPCLNGLVGDLDVYRYLTHFINKIDKDKIVFITQHREMRRFLNELESPVDLVNIDHHHDIEYIREEIDDTENEHDGNWVKTYFQQGKINSYCWICNVNSTPAQEEIAQAYSHESFYISEDILETLNPDKLIICLSPEWVPPVYYPLYTLWKESVI